MVLQNEPLQSAAMEEVKLDLERARMEREDFRQMNGPRLRCFCEPQTETAWQRQCIDGDKGYSLIEALMDVREHLQTKRRRKVGEAIEIINEEIEEPSESEN